MKFKKYTKGQFDWNMINIVKENNFGFVEDITKQWREENISNENIYKLSTKNKSLDIIIFSSISIIENKTRNHGEDAVRLVFRWKTKNGEIYKRIAKHYRVEGLFKNIENTLKNCQSQIFNLNYKEFSKKVEA